MLCDSRTRKRARERERRAKARATATRRRRPVNEQSSPARMQSRLFRDIITFAAAFGLPAIVLCVSEFYFVYYYYYYYYYLSFILQFIFQNER